jgi:16S rRNA (uracil1498-N3)-methyltransferase
MALPFFYIDKYDASAKQIVLAEESSRHIVQVLRMSVGDPLNLTDGKGYLLTASIVEAHKKHCLVRVEERVQVKERSRKVAIGISLLKNASRFEWFLEKATEIGIAEIIPLICTRTEKERFRQDRMQAILISAMLQSQQCWLPVLHEPMAYELLFRQEDLQLYSQKWIAHCEEDSKEPLSKLVSAERSQIILIGPEGDFTGEEIQMAIDHQFIAVALGDNRLRSETAGMVAATMLVMA